MLRCCFQKLPKPSSFATFLDYLYLQAIDQKVMFRGSQCGTLLTPGALLTIVGATIAGGHGVPLCDKDPMHSYIRISASQGRARMFMRVRSCRLC